MSVRESSVFRGPIGRTLAVTCFVTTVAACGALEESTAPGTETKESPLFFEPGWGGDLWNGGRIIRRKKKGGPEAPLRAARAL